MDADRYLTRIGLAPADVDRPSLAAAERLQRAHVATVPFETLSVTGDPFDGADDGAGVTQYREPGDDDWQDRYLFSDVPRELSSFEATCDSLQHAPESPFTGDPVVSMATDDGHVKLRVDSLTRIAGGAEVEESVREEDWHDVLEREFGLRYGSESVE